VIETLGVQGLDFDIIERSAPLVLVVHCVKRRGQQRSPPW
jgi:hypothetical protein